MNALPNPDPDDIISAMVKVITQLPPEQQEDAVLALIGAGIKKMRVCHIDQMRYEITKGFDLSVPVVQRALELLDGQIALREIGGMEGWR